MNYNSYHNCLRLQITVDDVSQERIGDLVQHCREFGFDNVMLMLNTEEFNLGHITIEEVRPWMELFKDAAKQLRENGISVSLNNWIEIGHCDRGRTLKEGQDFTLFVDQNGRQSTMVACPLCENWRAYYIELVKYLVSELKPDTYWVEDDFRIHNHAPLSDLGCYCEKHMAQYNARLGTNYTREEFVKKIFAPGPCTPERRIWFDVNRETIVELADTISRAVKEASPETDVALMSSAPGSHCLEARDWRALFGALSQGGNRINRIHLPYGEMSGKDYLYYFNQVSMGIRALSGGDNVIVMPETEHGTASAYLKSARFLQFGLEASIPLVTSGMTYSIYDFVGNGVRESLGFGKVVRDLKPYMQAVLDLNLKFSALSGVIIPIDERVSLKRSIVTRYQDLSPKEYALASVVSAYGMSYAYSADKEFSGKTLFLCSSNIDCFTDSQLSVLFENNYIIIEGTGVLALEKRGLLHLIRAKSVKTVPEDIGFHTYEEPADASLRIDGVRRMRGSCRSGVGPFTEIKYEEGILIETVVKNQHMETLAPAVVSGDGFTVWPYLLDEKRPKQFCDLRRYFFLKTAAQHAASFAICDLFGVSPYYFDEPERKVLVLINGNYDDFDRIPLRIGSAEFKKISVVCRDGRIEEAEYTKNGSAITVHVPFEGLTSKVLILE